MSRCCYTARLNDAGMIVLVDIGRGPTRSLTNDMEAVLQELGDAGFSPTAPIIYRDSEGVWDQVWHDNWRLRGFGPLGVRTEAAAMVAVGRLQLAGMFNGVPAE